MGRLFWKFFFFIWLAQLTAVTGIGGTLWLKHRSDVAENEAERRTSAALTINAAATALHFGGVSAMQHVGESLHRYRIFLLDDSLQDVFGRPVSPQEIARAQQSLSAAGNPLLARKEKAPDQSEYFFFLGESWDAAPSAFLRDAVGAIAHAGGPPRDMVGSPRDMTGPPTGREARPRPLPFGPPHGRPPDSMARTFIPFIGGLLASLIFAALLARYFATPIRTLRGAFNSIAEGRLDTRVGGKMGRRRDELADLGRDFDSMAARFGALVDGQKRLLHDVSHELRSPLARLQVAIGLARQQPQKIDATLARIEREGERMDQLVGELLTLSRVEVGGVRTAAEAVNIGELLAMVVDNADFEAAARGKRVLLDAPDAAGAVVSGSFDLLYRAVENIVRNAVKHTAVGADATLQARIDAHQVSLAVVDHGPGVPEKELKAIFEPFFRGSGDEHKSDGYGLGLAIARRVVQAHGGEISAQNMPQGGLRVEIRLPLDSRA